MQTPTPTAAAGQPAPQTDAPVGAIDTEQHSTRSAPRCIDCAHHTTDASTGHPLAYCNAPRAPINLVTGRPDLLCRTARSAAGNHCGALGWWFSGHAAANDQAEATAAPLAARLGFAPTDYWQPPRIGEVWAGQGGIYAGIARGPEGTPDAHLILCATEPDTDLSWGDALKWAADLDAAGFRDWLIPSRAESAVLFGNVRELFKPGWHWTSEQYSRYDAWYQHFDDGTQNNYNKSFEGRARAVRRLVIQPFNPS